MEDKELKKRLRKVPDVDSTGEPIWKIERAGGKSEKKKRSNLLPFPGKDLDRRAR
jgi:hypothetical protein